MSAARDPEEVLASIRRLVAKEVKNQQDREAAERPDRDMPVVSEKASAAARRLVLGADARIAANGTEVPAAEAAASEPSWDLPLEPVSAAEAAEAEPVADLPGIDEAKLRNLVREILREEIRNRMGPRINENIRRILREELRALAAGQD
ncbi:hypothetical protein [Poseidonocella sp. HB161398]|uniref:hypothetical protein n=1 Tax=Poseidonocella sp. HB161398 TaxID=2320855 RepID=UPI00110862C9|nr:hypothetical protein [Poseidonocella sp. HB161398]